MYPGNQNNMIPHKNVVVLVAAFVSIMLLIVARHHPPSRRKIKEIWHGRVFWEGESNTTMLRAPLHNKTLSHFKSSPNLEEDNSETNSVKADKNKLDTEDLCIFECQHGDPDLLSKECLCKCERGYSGKHCEITNKCSPDGSKNTEQIICQNDGIVSGITGECGCMCQKNYEGTHCEIYKWPMTYFIQMNKEERINHVATMMKEHPRLNAKIWNAITPDTMHDEIYSKYVNRKTFEKVRTGAIGCALSHVTVLKHFLTTDARELLVFEDDAQIDPDFENKYIKFRENLPDNFDMCQLLHHPSDKNTRPQKKYKMDNKYVMKAYGAWGTVSLLYSRKGAKRLLDLIIPISNTIDDMIKGHIRANKLNAYMPVDDLVTMPYKYQSNIWNTKINTVIPSNKLDPICKSFPNVWTSKKRADCLKLLDVFHNFAEEINAEYAIIGGTAIGYMRHNKTLLPWEDDIDVYLRPEDVSKMKARIDKSDIYCHASLWLGFKMFRCDSPKIGKYEWRWPMIDIFTTKNNWNTPDIMWPSKLSTLEGQTVRIPNDIHKCISTEKDNKYMSKCVSSGWNHEKEKGTGFGGKKIPCKELVQKCGSQWPKYMWPMETPVKDVLTKAPNVIVSNAIDDKKPDTKPPKSNFCKSYPSIYSGQLYEESLDIILHIQKVLSAAKMEWSIAFGTSLGWKRGNTFTPYDDDMDIVIKKRDSKPFRQLFKPPFCTATFWGGLKVFKCSRPSAGKYKWKTPFVDVWDGTHMSSKWKYEDSFMFPTRPTVFAGYIVQVSKNIEKHLAIKYPTPDNCTTLTWNHIKEQRNKEKRQTHPCSEVQKQCFSDKIDVYRYPPLITNSSKRQEILYDMLQWFDNIASKYDIKYSLVYGTLLGWRREGHIISKDTDLGVQIGSVGISKLVHLIDTGIAKAASEHGGINTNKITLLVRKTHDRLFSDVQRTNCKGEPVSRMVDGCAFNGPIARVMFKGNHVDIYFRSSYVPGAPSAWHCRKNTGCVYSQSRYSVPLPEVYPCRLGPVDTTCFGPSIVKQHLNEIYGKEWIKVGKKVYY